MIRNTLTVAFCLISMVGSATGQIDDFRLHRNHTRSSMQSYKPGVSGATLPRRPPMPGEGETIAYAEHLFNVTEARAMVLIEGGHVVWERVKLPATHASPFHGYSVTKSILSVGVGKAICSGLLSLDERLDEHVPSFASTALGRATVRDMLTMASGSTSSEPGGGLPALVRAVDFGGPEDIEAALLFEDTPKTRRGLFGAYRPGEVFDYKNTDPEALGLAFHKKTGRSVAQWLSESVLAPAGVAGPAYFGADRMQHTNTSYGMRMPIEDWSRLAIWIKAQSKTSSCFGDYLRTAMTRQIHNVERRTGASWSGYGYLFWTDAHDAPGSVWALGYGGQRIAWSEKNDRILIIFSTAETWTAEGLRLFNLWNRAAGK
ncbi:MAG: serine hydrolase domain-containing protein [Pseudomonadota bacterium]